MAAEIIDPIMQDAFIFPVKTNCGHYYEIHILDQMLHTHKNTICSYCRAEIREDQLNFLWKTSFKIIKIMKCMINDIEKVSQRNCLAAHRIELPPNLREENINTLIDTIIPIKEFINNWLKMIKDHAGTALIEAQKNGDITTEQVVDAFSDLKKWVDNF